MKLKANWLKWKRKEKKRENFNFVTCEELLKGETYLLKMSQEESYPSELKSLLLNDNVHKSSTLVPLNPTLNNQSLICVGGRVKNSDIFANSNYQVIVNKDHPIAKLIIKHYHEENLHVGREQTLSSLRSKYWIPVCRGIIRSLILSCLYCKREKIKPAPPFMPDIPEDRLCIYEKPFSNTGVDYLGSYHIKLSKRSRSNQATAKKYVTLFTCLTTRTVHLEIAGDLSTDAFVLALRRLISSRGREIDNCRKWRSVQAAVDVFWSRWKKEYLPFLNLGKRWTQKNRNFRVGDLLIISSHDVPRSHWPIGRITEVYPGRDGVRRSVKLKTKRLMVSYLCPVCCCAYLKQQINEIHFLFGRREFVMSKHNNFIKNMLA